MLPFSGALRRINPHSQTPVTAIIPYIIYFLITVAYAVKRRAADSIPGAFTLGRWAWPVIGFVLAYTVLLWRLRKGTAGVKPISDLVDRR